ncbi:translation machinery-associated protein 16 [Rhodotorula kratochvilovae]
MPNNKVKTAGALQGKKSKVAHGGIHPNSRRAKQLQRVELRTKKLEVNGRVRRAQEVHEVDRLLYFVHAIPEDATSLSLPELHDVLVGYLHRHQSELVALAAEREARSWRKTEGKGKREVEIEKMQEEETSEYRSGFVLPDLTLPENVAICRQWVRPAPSKEGKNTKGGDPSFIGRIRLIRIFSEDKNTVILEKTGAREAWGQGEGEVEMGDDAAPVEA